VVLLYAALPYSRIEITIPLDHIDDWHHQYESAAA